MKNIIDKPEKIAKISKKIHDRTMGDSINRQATIDALKIDCSWDIFDEYGNVTERGQDIIEAISRVPPAEPRKKGKWIDTGSGQECSECHEIQYGYDNFRYFCAFCGADMRGEQE